MREIVLDTETTGLDPLRGDRLVEVGCIEIFNRMPTGQTFHRYINPEPGLDGRETLIVLEFDDGSFTAVGLRHDGWQSVVSNTFAQAPAELRGYVLDVLERVGEQEILIPTSDDTLSLMYLVEVVEKCAPLMRRITEGTFAPAARSLGLDVFGTRCRLCANPRSNRPGNLRVRGPRVARPAAS